MKKPVRNQIKKFTVVRKRWGMGSLFDSESKKMCCLGFLARECGAPIGAIRDEGMPSHVPDTVLWPQKLAPRKTKDTVVPYKDRLLTRYVTDVNDDDSLSSEEKEKRLKKLFKKADIEICFK